jgi:hypothetical protein
MSGAVLAETGADVIVEVGEARDTGVAGVEVGDREHAAPAQAIAAVNSRVGRGMVGLPLMREPIGVRKRRQLIIPRCDVRRSRHLGIIEPDGAEEVVEAFVRLNVSELLGTPLQVDGL